MGKLNDLSVFRRFCRRCLGVVATLVVLICIYAAFAWAIIHHSERFYAIVGETWTNRFVDVNTRVLGFVFSGDRDHDGIGDGLEMALGTDLRNPDSQSYVLEPDGLRMFVYNARNIGMELHAGNHRDQLLEPGERRTVRIRLANLLDDYVGWSVVSHHLRVRIYPSLSSMAGAAGGVLSGSPVDVQVERGGILVFDLQALTGKPSMEDRLRSIRPVKLVDTIPGLDFSSTSSADGDFPLDEFDRSEYFTLKNAVTGDEIGQFTVRRAWRKPPITPSVEVMSKPDLSVENLKLRSDWNKYRTVRVSWPHNEDSILWYLLEIAEDTPEAEWFALQIYQPTDSPVTVAHKLKSMHFPYYGPLKYRVVPLIRDSAEATSTSASPE